MIGKAGAEMAHQVDDHARAWQQGAVLAIGHADLLGRKLEVGLQPDKLPRPVRG